MDTSDYDKAIYQPLQGYQEWEGPVNATTKTASRGEQSLSFSLDSTWAPTAAVVETPAADFDHAEQEPSGQIGLELNGSETASSGKAAGKGGSKKTVAFWVLYGLWLLAIAWQPYVLWYYHGVCIRGMRQF